MWANLCLAAIAVLIVSFAVGIFAGRIMYVGRKSYKEQFLSKEKNFSGEVEITNDVA